MSEPRPREPEILIDELDGPAPLISPWRAASIVDSALRAAAEALARGGDLLPRRTPDARAQS